MKIINLNLDLIASFAWSDSLGAKLRLLRVSRGLTREDLAKKTETASKKVSLQYIRQLETPHLFAGTNKKSKNPTASKDILMAICEALDVDIVDLLSKNNKN